VFQTAFISGDTNNCVVTCGAIAEKGPHVVDGQYLQLASSGSKAKELEN